MPSFTTPFETLVEHCKEHGLKCHADHGKKFIGFSMCGDAAVYKVRWAITHEDEVVQMDIIVPVHARDEKMRPLVLETLMRANHRLALGNFNLDHSDGEIVYHIACPIGEAGLEDQVICKLFGTALATTDRYFTALMRVMYGGHTPEDAVYLAELSLHSDNVTDENKPGNDEKSAPASKPSSKKSIRSPRKKNTDPKSVDRTAPAPDVPGNPPSCDETDSAKKDRPS
jgi:hypothetical protein